MGNTDLFLNYPHRVCFISSTLSLYLEGDQESRYKWRTQNETGGQCFGACGNGDHRTLTGVLLAFGNIYVFILPADTTSAPAGCYPVPAVEIER